MKKKTAAWLERIRQPGIRPFVHIPYDPEAEIGWPAATDKKRLTTTVTAAPYPPTHPPIRPAAPRGPRHYLGLRFSFFATFFLETHRLDTGCSEARAVLY